jgi:hypothetical protein
VSTVRVYLVRCRGDTHALFRHINSVARAALEHGGFLDGPDDLKRNARTGAKGKRKP